MILTRARNFRSWIQPANHWASHKNQRFQYRHRFTVRRAILYKMLNSDKELNCFLQMTINLMSTFITPLLSLLPVCFSLLQIEPDMTNTISYWFQSPPSIQNLVNCFSIRKSLWAVAIGNHRPLLEDTSEIHQDIQSPCRHRGGQKRLKNVSERAGDTLLMEWKLDGAEKKKPQGKGDMEK